MIKYLGHTITEYEVVDTKEKLFRLSHWYVSEKHPTTAGCRHNGYFKSHEEAENHHNELLVKGLIENERKGT